MDDSINRVTDQSAIRAAADLGEHSGAIQFEIGLDDEKPLGQQWYARYVWREAILEVDGLANPSDAADALAVACLDGGSCKCGRKVTVLNAFDPLGVMCVWQRNGDAWESSCDAPPVQIPPGMPRGSIRAMAEALSEHLGREGA